MSLAPGVRLGPYEVVRLIGTGGMGEVYKARDVRLDRTVAIKVLSEEFALDGDRRARFEREARAVAALNHPHICAVHDVGETVDIASTGGESIRFLVMEHLEGHTLADRLVRGPLPIEDVIRYATELADALDHAHRHGLVHRDLKPGNVMMTKTGVKLLDFGLSKLHASPDLITLATVSSDGPRLTSAGTVVGTFPYMAPEQLGGHEADARSDVFAFGAIVHEMATGRRAFEGTTAATVIGAILHTDPPPLSSFRPFTPPGLDRIVSRCLAKDPDDRWQSARDLMLELKWTAEHIEHSMSREPVGARRRKLGLMVSAVVTLLTIAVAAFALAYVRRAPANGATVRLAFLPPKELQQAEARFGGPVTISPDGKHLAYVATGADGKQLLWLQAMDSSSPRALIATDGAAYAFWSPDSRSIGFFAQGRLKRINIDAGPPQILSDALLPRGGAWSAAGVIVYSVGAGRELYQVAAGGGTPSPVAADGINEERHWPSFLPDGRHFLYFARRQKPGIYVASLESAETKLLASGPYMGVAYASPGYLLILKGGAMAGTLMAQPFDASRREFTGEAVPLAEQVPFFPLFARGDFSVSQNGTLLYGTLRTQTTQLTWFDREGKKLGNVPGATGYERPVLSPDERTIAADRLDPETQSQDVWFIETGRGATSRLTTNPGLDQVGLWSPNGKRIAIGSTRDGKLYRYLKTVDGTGYEESHPFESADGDQIQQMTDWSVDGRFFVYSSLNAKTKWDIWVEPVTREPATQDSTRGPYLHTEFNEHHGRLSPDGRWLAYASDESGKLEVYVQGFPVPGTRWRVSTDGGIEPRWRRDGKELFYQSAQGTLMAVIVKPGATFAATVPHALFKMPITIPTTLVQDQRKYLPTADGQRFLINVDLAETGPPLNTVVLNWPAALRR